MTSPDDTPRLEATPPPAYPDVSYLSWRECCWGSWGDCSGCVVHLPHTADRLDIGLAIGHTEVGHDRSPSPGDITGVRAAWGRLWTTREQWEYERDSRGEPVGDGPPPKWYADEGTPAWSECKPGDPGADEIWVVEW